MTQSAETLLRGVVDYAGLFPPARLDLSDAAARYDRYRHGAESWMLGGFVMSSTCLRELGAAEFRLPAAKTFPVSVVISSPPQDPALLPTILDGAYASVEFAPVPAASIGPLAAVLPRDAKVFFEVVPDAGLDQHLDAIASHGRLAKIRTGGVTPDAFPSPSSVYRFLRSCADRTLGCKATAGLHHALTGRYPLTYETGSATAEMYGFLNLCVGAALVHAGAGEDAFAAVLLESSPTAFRFDDDAVVWRGDRIPTDEIAATRRDLFHAFGSCSFEEPVDDLKRLRIL